MSALAGLRTDLVILACAISAGIHAALVPEHLADSTAAGAGFAGSAFVLVAAAAALTLRPASAAALAGAAVTLVALLVAYALAATTGLPVFHPQAESVDGLAAVTKALEAIGLAASLSALFAVRRGARVGAVAQPVPLALTALVSLFSVLAALAVTTGHEHPHDRGHAHAVPKLVEAAVRSDRNYLGRWRANPGGSPSGTPERH